MNQADPSEEEDRTPRWDFGPLQLSSVPLRRPLGLTYLKVQ